MPLLKSLIGCSLVSGSVFFYSYYGISSNQNIIVLNFEGSSSMKPVMEMLLHEYSQKNPSKKISFNVSSIGSNSGLSKVLDSTSEFALVSHDISDLPKNSTYSEKWSTRKLKTIVLAHEAILVLYKLPEGCDEELVISPKNIVSFYSLFSGHKNPENNETLDFSSLLDSSSNPKCKVKVIPWVKSTGPTKSGTAKAFVDNPLLKNACDSKTDDKKNSCEAWINKVKSGYGADYEVNYVPESTNLHWFNFSNNLKGGSMTYLPSNFVLQNWDFIQKLGIKFAKYKKSDQDSSDFSLSKESDIKDYEWKRPFNIVYSTNNLKEEVVNFLKFLVQQQDALTKFKLLPKKYHLDSTNTTEEKDSTKIDVSTPDECK